MSADPQPPPLRARTHGQAGPVVIVLHGGPAAAGEAEPVARGLSRSFRAIEPFQRGSGTTPLTVATHVDDLRRLMEEVTEDAPPSVVGHSWGAMLALAYACAYPDTVSALVLVGCGTFDQVSRRRLNQIMESRPAESRYDYDPLPADPQLELHEPFDAVAHRETWDDMLRLQADGTYPRAFARITCPVLMLHGDYDPHPGPMIRDSLIGAIPQLEYRELAHCGHSPWNERQARKEFFMAMTNWLLERS